MPQAKEFPFTIGADPEFNILLLEKRIHAEILMNKLFKDLPKDSNDMGYKVKNSGSIGWDGASATGEIRPAPSNSPHKVVENLRNIFSIIAEKSQLFELSTLSNKAPVGGHIHLEIKNYNDSTIHIDMEKLHKKLSSFYLPLYLGEDSLNLRIRNKGGYGEISDHREQNLGNVVTYEFRVPSAEWLTTPKVALGTLAYIATVYHEIIAHPKNISKNNDIIIKNQEQAKALQSLSITNFLFLTEVLLKRIKKAVKSFEYYDAYKEEIDFILNPAAVMKEKRKCNFEILKGWGLAKKAHFTKRDYLSEKKVKEAAKNIDLDEMNQAVEIDYNDDQYVSDFVRALKNRIITMNWRPKNHYFFFGLRNGINGYIIKNKNQKYLLGQELITTQKDAECVDSIFDRMNDRLHNSNPDKNSHLIVGIPYLDRTGGKIKKFLELIYDLEKNKYPATDLTDLVDTTSPDDNPIFKACFNETGITSQESSQQVINAASAELEMTAEQAF